METESTNLKDVAEPDQVVSGMAGTGQKVWNETENTFCVIPHAIARQIKKPGDEVFRMSVKRAHWYHYNVTVRTKSPLRELRVRQNKITSSEEPPLNKLRDDSSGGAV